MSPVSNGEGSLSRINHAESVLHRDDLDGISRIPFVITVPIVPDTSVTPASVSLLNEIQLISKT